ncbi:glycosyltransferase family 1 protein [Sporosarcina thermotolerans]|uniref:Glycosyltransferase family 1 protein n=2 Tax=Sporosarcina thermotolerans TaxID=633404 RepID=A0AAW9A553_9BACL|nr:glycosyltransferase family 1 protein [Sporosarcina thermotolerans]MDW0116282.1 glycosyltransferase family 1 protein [Sporosarcina thermotolerans]WHT48255.1 glycosyltransferase family 1 protein [Sporosarcina thermotolerans]
METKPVRILHVLGELNRGGAETMVMNLYRSIDRNRLQFDFIIHGDGVYDYTQEILSLGGRIYKVKRYNGKNHIGYVKAWKSFFGKYPEYKIIHGHVRSTASIYLSLAKKNGLLTISHSHSTSSGIGLSSVVKNLLQYPIRYIADYFFACSNSAGIWLFGKKTSKKDNFFVINNAINTKEFIIDFEKRKMKRKELGVSEKFVIGHVGRFGTEKNHEFLIDIFNEVYLRNRNSVLVLVGDGEQKQRIQQKVKKLDLSSNVIFTGVRSDIPDLLRAMDVFVFPSLFEGLPVTLVEAQASGLPCIVSNNITEEIKITSLIKSISLNNDAGYWAENILKFAKSKKRGNTYSDIVNSNYDISLSAISYQNFMLNKYEELKV